MSKLFIIGILKKQKQPPRGVFKKKCSENMQQIYTRTPMHKCDFNKVAKQSNFIDIALQHGCSSVNLLHIFRTPFPKNTSWWLLLEKLGRLNKSKLLTYMTNGSKNKKTKFCRILTPWSESLAMR